MTIRNRWCPLGWPPWGIKTVLPRQRRRRRRDGLVEAKRTKVRKFGGQGDGFELISSLWVCGCVHVLEFSIRGSTGWVWCILHAGLNPISCRVLTYPDHSPLCVCVCVRVRATTCILEPPPPHTYHAPFKNSSHHLVWDSTIKCPEQLQILIVCIEPEILFLYN